MFRIGRWTRREQIALMSVCALLSYVVEIMSMHTLKSLTSECNDEKVNFFSLKSSVALSNENPCRALLRLSCDEIFFSATSF